MLDIVETSIKFLDSVMKGNSFLKGTAAVFLLKNAGIKNQRNLKHHYLGVKGKLDLIQKLVTAESFLSVSFNSLYLY